MVNVLASGAVDTGGRVKPKTFKIGICCFFDNHAALNKKSK